MAPFSACCISGHIHEGTAEGTETVIAGLKSYVVGEDKKKAILLVHDIFGYESIVQIPEQMCAYCDRIQDFLQMSMRKLASPSTSLTSSKVRFPGP